MVLVQSHKKFMLFVRTIFNNANNVRRMLYIYDSNTNNKCNIIKARNKLSVFEQFMFCTQKYSVKTLAIEKVLSLKNPTLKTYLAHKVKQYENSKHNTNISNLKPLVLKVKEYWEKEEQMLELSTIIEENADDELVEMAMDDMKEITASLSDCEADIMRRIVPVEAINETSVVMELTAGVGGQEAMLFTEEVLSMYQNYAHYRGWQFELIEHSQNELGGVRKAAAVISGHNVYLFLKYEGGVHRVQRVPKTEKSGRIHTSTMTVCIYPQPSEIEVEINDAKDLKITTSSASGPGGQHVNKTHSAVRILHIPTDLTVQCQATRSQMKNKELALTMLRSKLYERKLEEQQEKTSTQKKLQAGTASRSEKIRTYNFQQDRVSDHRIGKNFGNICGFISGRDDLHDLIESLLDLADKESIKEILVEFERSQCSKS